MEQFKLTLLNSTYITRDEDDIYEYPFYSGLAFLQDGRIVATDAWNKKCYLMDQAFRKLGMYSLEEGPFDVTVISNEEIALTCEYGYSVIILGITAENDFRFIRSIKTTSKYNVICVKDSNTFIVSTYDDTVPVRTLSKHGIENNLDLNVDLEAKIFDFGFCSYNQDSEMLVLTTGEDHKDCTHSGVYMFDTKHQRYTIRSRDVENPRGVSTCPVVGGVLVCCGSSGSLVHLSDQGDVLGRYSLDMNEPFTCDVSPDELKLIVVSNADQKLHLYDIQHTKKSTH